MSEKFPKIKANIRKINKQTARRFLDEIPILKKYMNEEGREIYDEYKATVQANKKDNVSMDVNAVDELITPLVEDGHIQTAYLKYALMKNNLGKSIIQTLDDFQIASWEDFIKHCVNNQQVSNMLLEKEESEEDIWVNSKLTHFRDKGII